MSIRLQHLREAWSFLSTFTGRAGELVVDTTNNRLVVHDGTTVGGWPAAKLSEVALLARTAIQSSYSALITDRLIAVTSLIASLSITLPAAAAFQAGVRLFIIDETGVASSATLIKILPQGTDIVSGFYPSSIATPFGFLELESNGIGQWTISDGISAMSSSSTAATATSLSNAFSGQAIIGVTAPIFMATIVEPRLKAGMRPIVGIVNSAIASRGILADINMTGYGPGSISIFGVLFTLDGKAASSQMARLLLTLNYHGV